MDGNKSPFIQVRSSVYINSFNSQNSPLNYSLAQSWEPKVRGAVTGLGRRRYEEEQPGSATELQVQGPLSPRPVRLSC